VHRIVHSFGCGLGCLTRSGNDATQFIRKTISWLAHAYNRFVQTNTSDASGLRILQPITSSPIRNVLALYVPSRQKMASQMRHRGESESGVANSQNRVGIGAAEWSRTADLLITNRLCSANIMHYFIVHFAMSW